MSSKLEKKHTKNTKSESWSSFLGDMRRNQWIPAVFVSFSSPFACFQDLKQGECGEIKTAKPQTSFLSLLRGGCESVEELVWRLICFSLCGFSVFNPRLPLRDSARLHVFEETLGLNASVVSLHTTDRTSNTSGENETDCTKNLNYDATFLSLWHSGNINDVVILLWTPGARSDEGK